MTELLIRHGTVDDVSTIVVMAKRFLETTPYGVLFPPLAGHLEMVANLVLQHGVALLAEHRPKGCPGFEPEHCDCPDGVKCRRCFQSPHAHAVVGMLGLVVVPHPLTGLDYVEEVCWWVNPEARKGLVGPRLLTAAEEWVSTKNVTMVKMVAPASSEVGKFLERQGYAAVETAFIKPVAPPTRTEPFTIQGVTAEDIERLQRE